MIFIAQPKPRGFGCAILFFTPPRASFSCDRLIFDLPPYNLLRHRPTQDGDAMVYEGTLKMGW